MPFRDRDWEDFQRDCDFFPAYTDYIFGVDTRPEVADEPGLHPHIYDPLPLPLQRTHGRPQTCHVAVYDPVRDATRARPCARASPKAMPDQCTAASSAAAREFPQMLPNPPIASLLRHESSLESLLPTPTPAPRTLLASNQPMALLRPNELAADPQYSFIPQQERLIANKNIIQAWSIMSGDAAPAQKEKAISYIKTMSSMAAAERKKYQNHEFAMLEAQETGPKLQANKQQDSLHYNRFSGAEVRQMEGETEREATWDAGMGSHTYAIRDISQLPAYVQSCLSQLWTCTEIVALQPPPVDQTQFSIHQQAQQYLIAFKQSVPPKGRQWVGLVIDGMLKLRRQGEDPLTVLKTVPNVESTCEEGAYW